MTYSVPNVGDQNWGTPLNNYLNEQATAQAAHLAATSGVHGVTGAVVGTTDTQVLSHKDLSDPTNTFAPWQSYVPQWTAVTTNPVLNSGSILGRYRQTGKTVQFYAQITMGADTTYGSGAWLISLPVVEVATVLWAFAGLARDVSAGQNFPVTPIDLAPGSGSTPGKVQIACDPATAGATLRSVSSTVPFTWATTDILYISGSYEAA